MFLILIFNKALKLYIPLKLATGKKRKKRIILVHFHSIKALTQKNQNPKYKIVVKKTLIDSHKNKDMNKT